jgi:hypothetical protein
MVEQKGDDSACDEEPSFIIYTFRLPHVPQVPSDSLKTSTAVTATISLVTNRKHAARMALQKRSSKVRKQFVDC